MAKNPFQCLVKFFNVSSQALAAHRNKFYVAASTQPTCTVLNQNKEGLQSIVTHVKKGVLLSFLIRHVSEIRHIICSVESHISLSESLIAVHTLAL